MINCQKILFSNELSQRRMAQAQKHLGAKIVNRIICFALYLLGVNRNSISDLLNIPSGSVRSIIRVILHDGPPAFEDRRRCVSTFIPPQSPKKSNGTLRIQDEWIIVDLGTYGQIKIPSKNSLQTKVILLTMLNNDLLSANQIAEVLKLSTVHIMNLARGLHVEDIPFLIDKRQGQQQEYRFTPEVKSELIQQFVLDVVVEGNASGKLLSEHLQERCKLSLSERSIRYHTQKLGLSKIKKSLPYLLAECKKNLRN